MMKRIVLAACLTVLALRLVAIAQAKADFSGTWTMDRERSESAANGNGPGPITLVIAQTPAALSIETRNGDRADAVVYKLDGSETLQPGGDKSTVRWDGKSLVIKTARRVTEMAVTTQETFRLDATERELTVERLLNVEHGYGGTLTGYARGLDVFTKKTTP